jgi:hypothetical protein
VTTRKPPHGVSVLRRWISDSEKATGTPVARQQLWVSFMVLLAMLDRVRDPDLEPRCLLKGGVAMELRFDLGARATKDLDLAVRSIAGEMVAVLDAPLANGHGDFTARRTAIESVRDTGTLRTTVKLDYRGRSWASVVTEFAPAEPGIDDEIDWVPAKPLDHVGLDGPEAVPCVSVRWQLAQKLHACTEPQRPGNPPNDWYRDLIDILLLWDLVEDSAPVRAACVGIFQRRQRHPWPPTVRPPAHWDAGYATLAADMNLPIRSLGEAVSLVARVITEIDQAKEG